MKIYKYQLGIEHGFIGGAALQLPVGAEPLRVGAQDGQIFLWALVSESAECEPRWFEVFATGQEILPQGGDSRVYIGSVDVDLDMPPFAVVPARLVFHVFERKRDGQR